MVRTRIVEAKVGAHLGSTTATGEGKNVAVATGAVFTAGINRAGDV